VGGIFLGIFALGTGFCADNTGVFSKRNMYEFCKIAGYAYIVEELRFIGILQ